MPFIRKRVSLIISEDEKEKLEKIANSRTGKKMKIERAQILLYYIENKPINYIAKLLKTNRPKIERCIDKALEFGINTALEDLPRKGRKPLITNEARAWFLSIACLKPKDVGLSSEFWTHRSLAEYIRSHSEKAGHVCLKNIARGTVSKILAKSDIKPHKISYYLQRKDQNFEEKMAQVL
jgi:transposase